eukprot:m51a1_g14318 hypothetical protein (611) ;mRNA; r:7102-17659
MGMLDYTFNQVHYLLSMSGLWPKNQDLIGTTLLLHIVEHLSPSNYFKANNVMSLPEVPEVFTSSWANREFLRSFRVQVSNLKCCYMLANYFESCLINYSSLADLFGFHMYESCVGFNEGGRDTCNGDSGGPLVHFDKEGRAVQVGLTSYGHGCAWKESPGVYTPVSSFRQWIDDTMARVDSGAMVCGYPTKYIGNSKCNQLCFSEGCEWDRTDCAGGCGKTCNNTLWNGVCDPGCAMLDSIGNGECDSACFDKEHNYDGGDCITFPNCSAPLGRLGDHWCQPLYNTSECHYDAGDSLYWQCNWDGGMCGKFVGDHLCAMGCNKTQVGDGKCKPAFFNMECNWDGTDCDEELCDFTGSSCLKKWLGDGTCHREFDMGHTANYWASKHSLADEAFVCPAELSSATWLPLNATCMRETRSALGCSSQLVKIVRSRWVHGATVLGCNAAPGSDKAALYGWTSCNPAMRYALAEDEDHPGEARVTVPAASDGYMRFHLVEWDPAHPEAPANVVVTGDTTWAGLEVLLKPVNVTGNSEQCGFYFMPYETLEEGTVRYPTAGHDTAAVLYVDVEWDDSSYLRARKGDRNYELLAKSTLRMKDTKFQGPFDWNAAADV